MTKLERSQSLPYPMFEITEVEIQLLIEARDCDYPSKYLCDRIWRGRKWCLEQLNWPDIDKIEGLLSKIRKAMGGRFCLCSYFAQSHDIDLTGLLTDPTQLLMRKIWVNKLLAFNTK